jgi:hypothetical protein
MNEITKKRLICDIMGITKDEYYSIQNYLSDLRASYTDKELKKIPK